MTYRAWVCETCKYPSRVRENVWACPGCDKDACESCFDRLAHCKTCAEGKTDGELMRAANQKGFSFELGCRVCGKETEGFDEAGPLCIGCAVVKAMKEEGDDCREAQDNTPSKGPFNV